MITSKYVIDIPTLVRIELNHDLSMKSHELDMSHAASGLVDLVIHEQENVDGHVRLLPIEPLTPEYGDLADNAVLFANTLRLLSWKQLQEWVAKGDDPSKEPF